jgi:hypothetical protein
VPSADWNQLRERGGEGVVMAVVRVDRGGGVVRACGCGLEGFEHEQYKMFSVESAGVSTSDEICEGC